MMLTAILPITDTPEVDGETDIQKALADIGVNYTHRNEDLIAENAIEKKRVEVIKEVRLAVCITYFRLLITHIADS